MFIQKSNFLNRVIQHMSINSKSRLELLDKFKFATLETSIDTRSIYLNLNLSDSRSLLELSAEIPQDNSFSLLSQPIVNSTLSILAKQLK